MIDTYKELMERYENYEASDEAYCVAFARKYLKAAKNHWTMPVFFRRTNTATITKEAVEKFGGNIRYHQGVLDFGILTVAVFPRKKQPEYPDKETFISKNIFRDREYAEEEYRDLCRAITWDTSHHDMESQIYNKGVIPEVYQIEAETLLYPKYYKDRYGEMRVSLKSKPKIKRVKHLTGYWDKHDIKKWADWQTWD